MTTTTPNAHCIPRAILVYLLPISPQGRIPMRRRKSFFRWVKSLMDQIIICRQEQRSHTCKKKKMSSKI
jgi:hypothetical protein